MAKNKVDFSLSNAENMAVASTLDVETKPAPDPVDDDGVDFNVGPEEAKPTEVVTLTPEEFAALKSSGDSARAVKDGIEGLASKLAPQVAPTPPVNSIQQTPEEFYAEHSDEFFDKDKGGPLMAKHSEMVAERKYGGLLRGLSSTLATTRKELLEAKDPYFKKYKTEVEQLVGQQPADVQMQPDVFERAWQAVRQRHQPEIEAESVKDQVDKAVEAKLKELGIDASKIPAGGVRPAVHTSGEGRSTPVISSSTRTQVRVPDAKTKAELEALALRKGMDLKDLLRTRGYIV